MPRTAAWGSVEVLVRIRVGRGADQQRGGACLASRSAMAETNPRPPERVRFGIPGEHLVGGGDVPPAGSGCVGLPDGMCQRGCPRLPRPVAVDASRGDSGSLTSNGAANIIELIERRPACWLE